MTRGLSVIPILAVVAACGQNAAPRTSSKPPHVAARHQSDIISFDDDFETDPFSRWDPVTKSAWTWNKSEQRFTLARNVPLTEPVRAPFGRNLIKGITVGDFQFDVDLKSTVSDYPNRDLALIFGYQDPAHLYYVHLGRQESSTSNNVFIVDGKDRTPISTSTTPGTPWDDRWHHARVVRDVNSGSIEVYFDDMNQPAMTANDRTFTSGQVGIGSFDDTGQFDNIVLRAKRARPSDGVR